VGYVTNNGVSAPSSCSVNGAACTFVAG
jgi:hypothetical protein